MFDGVKKTEQHSQTVRWLRTFSNSLSPQRLSSPIKISLFRPATIENFKAVFIFRRLSSLLGLVWSVHRNVALHTNGRKLSSSFKHSISSDEENNFTQYPNSGNLLTIQHACYPACMPTIFFLLIIFLWAVEQLCLQTCSMPTKYCFILWRKNRS